MDWTLVTKLSATFGLAFSLFTLARAINQIYKGVFGFFFSLSSKIDTVIELHNEILIELKKKNTL